MLEEEAKRTGEDRLDLDVYKRQAPQDRTPLGQGRG